MTVVNTRNTDKTLVTYFGDGVTRVWEVPFDYLHRDFIKVTVDGVDVPFVWLTKTSIETLIAPPEGTFLVIRRWTDAKRRLVNFKDGSILRARDLDLNAIQSLHISEEARDSIADAISMNADGQWEARHRRIVNVNDPQNPKDVANKQWVMAEYGGTLGQCYAARDRAVQAETRSVKAETRSVQAETRSVQAEDRCEEILVVAEQAEPSAVTAIAGAAEATKQADRATVQADRAENAANSTDFPLALGRMLHSVDEPGLTVHWKASMVFRSNPTDAGYSQSLQFTNGSGTSVMGREGAGFTIYNVESLRVGDPTGVAVYQRDGNVSGSVWGGYLSEYLNGRLNPLTERTQHMTPVVNGVRVSASSAPRLILQRPGTDAGIIYFNNDTFYVGASDGEGMSGSRMLIQGHRTYIYGDMEASGNVIAYSDIRQKRSVRTTPGLAAVKKLRGVAWTWKKGHTNAGKSGAGLIAQDVAKALPEAVTRNQDGYLGVNYNAVVGLLVNAVKELAGTVKDLQERLKKLEAV